MAQPINCDICGDEHAVQMLSNLTDGTVIAMGPACLPVFYGQLVLISIGSDGHAGPPTKCQACRRTHERMTTPVAPIAAEPPAGGEIVPPQLADGTSEVAP
jgi:hypothetical protein